MDNNDVVVRVAMSVVMPVMFVDNHVWFVPDDDFVSPYHRCEGQKRSEN